MKNLGAMDNIIMTPYLGMGKNSSVIPIVTRTTTATTTITIIITVLYYYNNDCCSRATVLSCLGRGNGK